MPGYANKHMKTKKMSGKSKGASMKGKGMPTAVSRKGGGPSMPAKGR